MRSLQARNGSRIYADAHDLPVRDECVDAVCCSAALHHFEDPHRVLSQVRKCLKVGGELFLSVPYLFPRTNQPDDYRRFDRTGILALLESTAWKVKLCAPIGGRYWVLSRTLLEGLFRWFAGTKAPFFLLSAPILGFAVPICCFYLDRRDRSKECTLGWTVIARKETS